MSMMSAQSSPLVAVAEELRGDRVTVGLVVDQHAAEVVTGLRVEPGEDGAEIRVREATHLSATERAHPICEPRPM